MIFANAGAHFSVDALLMKRIGLIGQLSRSVYYRFGLPSDNTLQITKFLTLLGYWAVCLYSLAMHIGEPAWMNGSAGPLLLSNNFMSRFHSEFSWFFSQGAIPVLLGRIALWAMLPWYLLLLPCVLLGGLARLYAILWGLLFFLLSMFVLQLGWLAHFEFIFFAGLFWEKKFIAGPKTLEVAYDDKCNLCDGTVRFVKFVDIFNRVELRPLSKNTEWLIHHKIDPADAQKDLYAVRSDRNSEAVKGYDFYLLLTREILLLLPFYPLLLIGQFFGGRTIYRAVAKRRTDIFGVCQIPSVKTEHRILPSTQERLISIPRHDPIAPFALHFLFVAAAYIVAIPLPNIWLTPVPLIERIREMSADPAATAQIYGITPINVFNHTDLRMAENWFTISSLEPGGREKLVPVLSPEGERLSAHRSDRVYFGNTVRYRRAVIGAEGCSFDAYRTMIAYLSEDVWPPAGKFVYRQYRQDLPDTARLLSGHFEPNETRIICEIQFQPLL